MNFWAEKLASAAPVTPTPSPAPPQTPWWALPTYTAAAAPATPPPAAPALPHAPQMRQGDPCPNCFGGNYHKATPNTAPRCMDCGYPVLHSTSGAIVPNRNTVPARAPLRQAGGSGNVMQIIGHV